MVFGYVRRRTMYEGRSRRNSGEKNQEESFNTNLIVMEALIGEEWVVNTVSLQGTHKVTDVWFGPPKSHISDSPDGPAMFLYDVQRFAHKSPRRDAVIAFTLDVLEAVGVQNGAAHTELVWSDGPFLLEVNARPAGGLPRTPKFPNQLEALAMSICDPPRFYALPDAPICSDGAAVVFLQSPLDGWITGTALMQLMSLPCFVRFERELEGLSAPYAPQRVHKTVGLFSSPGAVVLRGKEDNVSADIEMIRALEVAGAYVASLESGLSM